ncbi:hypothetical protein [Aeromicrobium sp.]|uniref:hypothetical protein n=1 Tax=Aeromicrobium sp. TaxID=1871063 RepID=UPI0030BCAEB2
MQAYAKAAAKALGQLERDCRFNLAVNKASVRPGKVYDQATKFLLKDGVTEPGGVFCDQATCVSSIAKKKNSYADLRIKSTKLYRSTALKLYQSEQCSGTSYRAACKTLAAVYDAETKAQLRGYEYVRGTRSALNNDKISKMLGQAAKVSREVRPRLRKAVLALDPSFKADKTIAKYPGWTDNFFPTAGKLVLDKLDDERAAIEKL